MTAANMKQPQFLLPRPSEEDNTTSSTSSSKETEARRKNTHLHLINASSSTEGSIDGAGVQSNQTEEQAPTDNSTLAVQVKYISKIM